jgi:hypothetical protein
MPRERASVRVLLPKDDEPMLRDNIRCMLNKVD